MIAPVFLRRFFLAALLWICAAAGVAAAPRPNIIFILADDLGYGEIGAYGQKLIHTPNIDRMAADGIRFTRFYAGATVCAPSRSVLMTGLHHGHTRVRGNAGPANPAAQQLAARDLTVARALQQSGYRTALLGKWGLGMEGGDGAPNKQGFDYFFGYLSQHHAHNHYPDYLWRNEQKVALANVIIPMGEAGAGYAPEGKVYADDLFTEEALQWIGKEDAKPFFLYLSYVVPHANNERTRALKDGAEVPDYGSYKDEPWIAPHKGQAAMISRLDAYVGRILGRLAELGIDERTLVIFSSDNGPHKESGNDPAFFQASGPFRGIKRSLTDGGIRVPFIARWPGRIGGGQVSSHVGYLGDFMATALEVAGVDLPPNLDSISLGATLFGGAGKQLTHRFLYWEFHEKGFQQAALLDGRWKGIRPRGPRGPLEVYDVANDPQEARNLAAGQPQIAAQLAACLDGARSESDHWPIKETPVSPEPPAVPGEAAAAASPSTNPQ